MEGLSELSTMYPNVKIFHFDVDLRNDRLNFKVASTQCSDYLRHLVSHVLTSYHVLPQFCLKDGVRQVPHYGLRLARVAGLPASVIDTATSITSQITEQVIWYLHIAVTT
jgi:DNA mismatch repair protein MSH4